MKNLTLALTLLSSLSAFANTDKISCYSAHYPPVTVEISADPTQGAPTKFAQTLGGGAGPKQEIDFTSLTQNLGGQTWPVGTFAGWDGQNFGVLTVTKDASGGNVGVYSSNIAGKLIVLNMICP